MAGRSSVLVVCTGNICRSPAAEHLLREGLGADADIDVASVGTAAVVGAPVAPPMAALLRGRGIETADWTARQLEPAHARDADLVLTMTAQQRSVVVSRAPSAVRRTFTLREFADLVRLLGGEAVGRRPGERLAGLLATAPRVRGTRSGGGPAEDDIEDPYGRGDEVFARVLAQIEDAVAVLVGALRDDRVVTLGDRRPGP